MKYIKESLLWGMDAEILEFGNVSYTVLDEDKTVQDFQSVMKDDKATDGLWKHFTKYRDGLVQAVNAAYMQLHQLEKLKDSKAKAKFLTPQIQAPTFASTFNLSGDAYDVRFRKLIIEINDDFHLLRNTRNAINQLQGPTPESVQQKVSAINAALDEDLARQGVADAQDARVLADEREMEAEAAFQKWCTEKKGAPPSVKIDKRRYYPWADAVTLQQLKNESSKNFMDIFNEKVKERDDLCDIYNALSEERTDLYNALHGRTGEPSRRTTTNVAYSSTLTANEQSFKTVKVEYNKFIGYLANFKSDIQSFEHIDRIQYDKRWYVRRVFKLSFVKTRSEDSRKKAVEHALLERNYLLSAVNKIQGSGSRMPRIKDNMFTETLLSDFDNCKNCFDNLIDERDELYVELQKKTQSTIMLPNSKEQLDSLAAHEADIQSPALENSQQAETQAVVAGKPLVIDMDAMEKVLESGDANGRQEKTASPFSGTFDSIAESFAALDNSKVKTDAKLPTIAGSESSQGGSTSGSGSASSSQAGSRDTHESEVPEQTGAATGSAQGAQERILSDTDIIAMLKAEIGAERMKAGGLQELLSKARLFDENAKAQGRGHAELLDEHTVQYRTWAEGEMKRLSEESGRWQSECVTLQDKMTREEQIKRNSGQQIQALTAELQQLKLDQADAWNRFDGVKSHTQLMQGINELYALIMAKNRQIGQCEFLENKLWKDVIKPIQEALHVDVITTIDDVLQPIKEKCDMLVSRSDEMKELLGVKQEEKHNANIVSRFTKMKASWKVACAALESERDALAGKLNEMTKVKPRDGQATSEADELRATIAKFALSETEVQSLKAQLSNAIKERDQSNARIESLEASIAADDGKVMKLQQELTKLTTVIPGMGPPSISNGMSANPAHTSTGGPAARSLTFDERLLKLLNDLSNVWPEQFPSDASGDRRVLIQKIRTVIDGLFRDTERERCVDLLVQELRPVRPVNGNAGRQPPQNIPAFVPVEARGRSAHSAEPVLVRDGEGIRPAQPDRNSPAARGPVQPNAGGASQAQLARMVGVSSLLQTLNDLCE